MSTPPAEPRSLRRQIRNDLIFLLLDSVPMWMRGRLYLRICRRQMERWHPELLTDPNWRARWDG